MTQEDTVKEEAGKRRNNKRGTLTVFNNLSNKGHLRVLVSGNTSMQLLQGCQHFNLVTRTSSLHSTTLGNARQEGRVQTAGGRARGRAKERRGIGGKGGALLNLTTCQNHLRGQA